MEQKDRLFELQVFAGEGDGGAGAGTTGTGANPSVGSADSSPSQGSLDTSVGAADSSSSQGSQDAQRREAFEKAIAENKDLYEERLKQQLDRRMKGTRRDMDLLKGQNARFNGLAQAIAQRYGIDEHDMDGLEKAVREDQSWLEEQAAKNGLTVEQQKHMNELEAKNRAFEAAREAAQRQAQKDATLAKWQREADALKGVYPGFELETEIANEDFTKLLGNGVSMQTAYEVVHHDELVTGAMQYAVQRTAGAVAASVRANGLRPVEGAGGGNAPSGMAMDVHKLTKAQRDEIEERAKRGERITLR